MIATLLTALALVAPAPAAHAAPTTRCTEDAPCWNWTTMGNHKRGIAVRTHNDNGEVIRRIINVTPREYCARKRAHQIIYTYTIPLKGDPTCL